MRRVRAVPSLSAYVLDLLRPGDGLVLARATGLEPATSGVTGRFDGRHTGSKSSFARTVLVFPGRRGAHRNLPQAFAARLLPRLSLAVS